VTARDRDDRGRVRIPADVERPDKLLAGLTARQLAILGVAAVTLWAGYAATRHVVPAAVYGVIALPVGALAAMLALGRFEGVAADQWVSAAWRHHRSPHHLVPASDGVPATPAFMTTSAGPMPDPLRLPFAGVSAEGIVDLGPDGFAVICRASAVTFSLRTPTEQEALVATFARWLNGLDREAQILVRAEPVDLTPAEQASIFYTSGTTGPSKGVAMPHGQMFFFGEEVVSLQRVTPEDTYLTTTPLFHGNAQFMAAYPALVAGARLVIRSKFSASRWVDHLRENDVTVTNLVGVMMDFVWKAPSRPDDADNKLRSVYAAPTASSILKEFMARFGIEAMVDAFGLTETCAPILSPYGEIRPPGAAGLVASDFFEIRLVDPETDEEVPVGQIGELVLRYKYPWTCSLGYFGMPEKTAEAWRNLWFHTGDALKRDEEGWYYFVDRYKDALRRRGENISSYEVEQAVLSFPSVTECTVLGVPAEQEAGEDEVLAVIVTSEPVRPEEIWAWCEGKVPAFAMPRFIRFVDAIPRTPSEKVRKADLRADGITSDTHDRSTTATAPG